MGIAREDINDGCIYKDLGIKSFRVRIWDQIISGNLNDVSLS